MNHPAPAIETPVNQTASDQEPEWLAALRAEAQRTSQRLAGTVIGYSAAAVSLVLKGTYTGNLDRIESAVKGALLGATIECPVLSTLRRDVCAAHQVRKFAATNPMRIELYHACRSGCPHSNINPTE